MWHLLLKSFLAPGLVLLSLGCCCGGIGLLLHLALPCHVFFLREKSCDTRVTFAARVTRPMQPHAYRPLVLLQLLLLLLTSG